MVFNATLNNISAISDGQFYWWWKTENSEQCKSAESDLPQLPVFTCSMPESHLPDLPVVTCSMPESELQDLPIICQNLNSQTYLIFHVWEYEEVVFCCAIFQCKYLFTVCFPMVSTCREKKHFGCKAYPWLTGQYFVQPFLKFLQKKIKGREGRASEVYIYSLTGRKALFLKTLNLLSSFNHLAVCHS